MIPPQKPGYYWYCGDETRIKGQALWQPVRVDPKEPKDQEFRVQIFVWGWEFMDNLYGEWGPEVQPYDGP